MDKKVLVVGGTGGREHALAWKLSKSPAVGKVYIAPGNGGTATLGENVNIDLRETDGLIDFCRSESIDLIVIGPDDLLANGLTDDLRQAGLVVFGPSKNAARIESSKAFAKDMMKASGVPTAKYKTFKDPAEAASYAKAQDYPLVVKASGLALGKGVLICEDFEVAKQAIDLIMVKKAFKSAGDTVVIEEYLAGSEVSFHALCGSGSGSYTVFPSSQDHKQIFDNDKGPNTGGMGAFAPVPWASEKFSAQIEDEVIRPILRGMEDSGNTFAGCLYPGVMVTSKGPKVLEFNARFGDPETQAYMRLLKSDLYDLLYSYATNKPALSAEFKSGFAVSVVIASGGYPGNYKKGLEITGIDEAEKMDDIVVFHAGTKLSGNKLVTSGGRVLNVSACAATLEEAIEKAYAAVRKIHFDNMHYRKDIGRRSAPEVYSS